MNSYIITKLMLSKMDRDEIIDTLKITPFALELLDEKLKDDEEIVLTAVETNGDALQFASSRLKKNVNVVYTAIKSYPRSLMYAHKSLRDNDKLRSVAFAIYGGVFIVDPIAWKEFEYRNALGIYQLKAGEKFEYQDNDLYNVLNNFQLRFARFYGLCDDYKMTPWELREFEKQLIRMRRERRQNKKGMMQYNEFDV
ncbi:MAG: DUF4116 domain-containing protein [Clostridia bacterium]|nr:DUF4116 domain-containing protein [Clostridia bacterium]